jgi:hypothetical protein
MMRLGRQVANCWTVQTPVAFVLNLAVPPSWPFGAGQNGRSRACQTPSTVRPAAGLIAGFRRNGSSRRSASVLYCPCTFFRQLSPLTKATIGRGRLAPVLSKETVSPLLCLLFEPRSRLAARALQCFKAVLEHINWLDGAIRPFGLDLPPVTVAQHDAENRFWGTHEAHNLRKSSDGRISNSRA